MMAKSLSSHGARVYIASRKQKVVDETAAEINSLEAVKKSGGRVIALSADLATKANCDALAKKIEALEGGPGKAKLHALVNNSGISWAASLEEFPEEKGWRNILNVNVIAMYYSEFSDGSLARFSPFNQRITCNYPFNRRLFSDDCLPAHASSRRQRGQRPCTSHQPRFHAWSHDSRRGLSHERSWSYQHLV